jgi:hypothetical protein
MLTQLSVSLPLAPAFSTPPEVTKGKLEVTKEKAQLSELSGHYDARTRNQTRIQVTTKHYQERKFLDQKF